MSTRSTATRKGTVTLRLTVEVKDPGVLTVDIGDGARRYGVLTTAPVVQRADGDPEGIVIDSLKPAGIDVRSLGCGDADEGGRQIQARLAPDMVIAELDKTVGDFVAALSPDDVWAIVVDDEDY